MNIKNVKGIWISRTFGSYAVKVTHKSGSITHFYRLSDFWHFITG